MPVSFLFSKHKNQTEELVQVNQVYRKSFTNVDLTKESMINAFKTNFYMILAHAIETNVLLQIGEFIRENTLLWLLHRAAVTVHTHQIGGEQLQQHNDMTDQVENSSSLLRKCL